MVYIPYMTVLYMVYNPQQTCEAGENVRKWALRARSASLPYLLYIRIRDGGKIHGPRWYLKCKSYDCKELCIVIIVFDVVEGFANLADAA